MKNRHPPPSGVDPLALREQTVVDAAAQASAQNWLEIEYYQVDSGPFEGSIHQLDLGSVRLCEEQHNRSIQKRGRMAENRCTLSVPPVSKRFGWFGEHAFKGEAAVFFLPGGAEFDLYMPGPLSSLYIAFEQAELLAAVRALNPCFWDFEPTHLLQFDTPHKAVVSQAVQFSMALCRGGSPAEQPALQRTILHNMVVTLNDAASAVSRHSPGQAGRRRKVQIVRQAHDIITAYLEAQANPTVVDLCAQLNVSERMLQYAFRELLDLTPIAYLRVLRLNRVRTELRRPAAGASTTVTRIATRYGFLHLSKFAQDYRRQFGELPSQTLQRAQQ